MGNTEIDDLKMLDKVKVLLNKLDETKKLQDLASDNGLDVRNKLDLTEDARENIAVSVVALLIAKELGDPSYEEVVRVGIDKRQKKTVVVNKYKNQAIQLINRYRNESKVNKNDDSLTVV